MSQNSIQIINLNGKKLYTEHYKLYENRPTIIFLHDSLGCVQLWRDFPQKLAQVTQFNILIYDRLGYGKSDPMPTFERPTNYLELEADVLNDLLTVLEIDNIILFGHSDGATIALHSASKYPKRIKAVIVEAAHIFVDHLTLAGIAEAVKTYETTNLAERLAKYHGNKVDTLFKAWTKTWTRTDYQDWNIEYILPEITCPLLFIQGEADEYGTLEQVEKTISQVSGKAEKFIIPNTGHTPHKEAPEIVLNNVIPFIENI